MGEVRVVRLSCLVSSLRLTSCFSTGGDLASLELNGESYRLKHSKHHARAARPPHP